MFTSAEKTSKPANVVKATSDKTSFFRKAGEEGFFGSTERTSFFSQPIQAKLSVSSPDDPQEREADEVASQVMRMPEPTALPQQKDEEKLQAKEEEVQQAAPVSVQRMCASCESEQRVHPKLFRLVQRSEESGYSFADDTAVETAADYNINRKELSLYNSDIIQCSGRGPPATSPQATFESGLSSSKGSGALLPASTKQFMETRFGADFGGVRIHTGSYAQNLSSSIHAQAFTHGNDIYFNYGKYAPHTEAGGTLLAHELTHTIQQGASAHRANNSSLVAPKIIARKEMIHRSAAVPAQLTNAVARAKTVEGKIDANKPQADGNRTGWEHLVDIFKTTFGEEKIISNGQPATPGAIAEQDIKKKRETTAMIVDKTTVTTANAIPKTTEGKRDAMPSWCGIFVFWALNKSGVPMPKWKLGQNMMKFNAARKPGETPLPGDIAYRNAYSHFAIVESAEGGTVKTVNGNTAGEDNLGGQVQTKDHPMKEWTAFFDPLKIMEGELGPGEAIEPPVPPKTLAEIRADVMKLHRKEDAEDEHTTNDESSTEIQPKTELSNWHVNTGGALQTITPVQRATEEKELQKKEEHELEEEPPAPTITRSIQRKESNGYIDCSVDTSIQRSLATTSTNAQRNINDANSSLTDIDTTGCGELQQAQDRGPPVQCKQEHDVVQRSVIDDALAHTSLGELTDCLGIDMNEVSACLLRKASDIVMYIPGYRALRVVLGRDPITHAEVERNGRNLLDAAFDIMPGGNLIQQKLSEEGLLDSAAAWIDGQIASLEAIVDGLFSEFDRFWNSIEFGLDMSPMGVLRDGANIVLRFINNVIDFAVNAASEILEMIKDYLLNAIVDFIKENTTAYPLLTVILGEDPVTKQRVDRNGTNILNAILELGGEEGIQQRTQMQETGTYQRVVGYIDEGILVFGNLYDTIVQNFSTIWDRVTIEALMNPVETFRSIYNIFAEPVTQVLDFVIRVAAEILRLIKEVLMQRLSAWARTVRGYQLVTVIIGRDPFTNEEVPFSMENVIRGFFSLMEGGIDQYNQLKETGAIDRTTARITAAVNRLNMTPAAIVQLFIDLWNSFTIGDLMDPIACFQRILDRFGEPIGRLIAFVIEIVKIVIEAILTVMNFPFDLINNIIARSMAAFDRIKQDPVAFLKNLLRAIKQGFIQFFDNILQHLVQGLVGWLMSELRDAGIPELTDLSLRGVIAWVLEVLGISMERIWQKLAAHPRIGPQRVARIRGMINTLEGIWTFIHDVQERGMAAIWDKIQEQLTNLWDTILDAVKNWVMEQIINRMVTRLLSMLDPTGIMAVVNSAIAIYSAIQSFIRYLREMLEVVNSFVNGVADIAEGNVTTAANYLERTMGRAMPIVIGFLANQVGLSGIGRRVGEMIERARELVDQALTWLVNRAVDTGMNLLDRVMAMGRSAVDAVRSGIFSLFGFRRRFRSGNVTHSLYFEGTEDAPVMMVASNPKPLLQALSDRKTEIDGAAEGTEEFRNKTAWKNRIDAARDKYNNDLIPAYRVLRAMGDRISATEKSNQEARVNNANVFIEQVLTEVKVTNADFSSGELRSPVEVGNVVRSRERSSVSNNMTNPRFDVVSINNSSRTISIHQKDPNTGSRIGTPRTINFDEVSSNSSSPYQIDVEGGARDTSTFDPLRESWPNKNDARRELNHRHHNNQNNPPNHDWEHFVEFQATQENSVDNLYLTTSQNNSELNTAFQTYLQVEPHINDRRRILSVFFSGLSSGDVSAFNSFVTSAGNYEGRVRDFLRNQNSAAHQRWKDAAYRKLGVSRSQRINTENRGPHRILH